MTIVIVAIAAILVLLALIRVNSKTGATIGSSARPTRDRRSGRDRRVLKVRVPRQRRRASRRLEDAAADYVARIDKARPSGTAARSKR